MKNLTKGFKGAPITNWLLDFVNFGKPKLRIQYGGCKTLNIIIRLKIGQQDLRERQIQICYHILKILKIQNGESIYSMQPESILPKIKFKTKSLGSFGIKMCSYGFMGSLIMNLRSVLQHLRWLTKMAVLKCKIKGSNAPKTVILCNLVLFEFAMIGYVNWGFGVPENASKNQGLKFKMANPIWLTQMTKLLLSLAPNYE